MTTKGHTAEADDSERDAKGRFLSGNKGGGRSKGARSRLGEAFIEALAADFNEHGVETIEKVRTRDPTAYVKVISNILPREVLTAAFNVNATLDPSQIEAAEGFLAAYRFARDRIGAPLIEAEPLHAEEGAVVTQGWRADD